MEGRSQLHLFFEMNVTLGHALDSGVELRLLLDQDGRVVPSPRGRIQAGHSQSDQTQPGLQHKQTDTHRHTLVNSESDDEITC